MSGRSNDVSRAGNGASVRSDNSHGRRTTLASLAAAEPDG